MRHAAVSIPLSIPLSIAMSGALLLALGSSARAADDAAPAASAYPLTTCVVSGEDLGTEPTIYQHEGREVRFCCAGCVDDFKKDPATYLAKLDAAAKAAKTDKPAAGTPAADAPKPVAGDAASSDGKPAAKPVEKPAAPTTP